MDSVQIKAFAKINLVLDVLHKRPDGYHEVEMIMQGINLYDLIEITELDDRICVSSNLTELDNGPLNLAWQAADLLIRDFPHIKGIKIHLHKSIPIAAGLAGGSTDAATVLVGMNKLFDLKLPRERMLEYAAKLGSDVPFCLLPLTALAQGRGEKIRMLPECPRIWMVVAKPPFGVATKEIYSHLHNVAIVKRPKIELAISAIRDRRIPDLYKAMGNVLEYSTFDLYPQLREWVDTLKELGANKVMMSGSGPTLLAFCDSYVGAQMLAAKWQKSGWETFTSRTLGIEDVADFCKEDVE